MSRKSRREPQDSKNASTLGRIDRLATLFNRSSVQVALLALILGIAIILRVTLLRWGYYLNEYDPFFFYRVAEYIAKNGLQAWSVWHDSLSWYPLGRYIALSSYPGVSFTAAIIYGLLSLIWAKITLLDVSMFFPVFMACLTVIVAYFLGRDLGGKPTGIVAALMLAVSPSYISRTVAGFFNTDSAGIFGISAVALLFLRSLDEKMDSKRRILYALSAGAAMGFTYASWGGARYIVGLVTLFTVASLILGKSTTRLISSYAISMGLGLFLAVMVPHLGVKLLFNVENLVIPAVLALLVTFELLKTRIPVDTLRLWGLVIVAVVIATVVALPLIGVGNGLSGKFLLAVNPFAGQSSLYASIGENKLASWDSYFSSFGILMILAAFGAYLSLKEISDIKLYSCLFFLTALYFTGTLVRLLPFLAFPTCLIASFGLVKLAEPFKAVLARPDSGDKRKNKQFGLNKGLAALLVILVAASFIPLVLEGWATGDQPGPLATSGVPIVINGKPPSDWVDALSWIKANTTKGSVISAWWDYGYWIETMANRTTIADGSTLNAQQIIALANMMIKPSNESLSIMKKYDVQYVVVFVTFNPNAPIVGRVATPSEEQSYPLGDNAKWIQMALIASYNQTQFYNFNQSTGSYSYTKLYTNSTIARMMYQTFDIKHFQLVYKSKLGWVLIYKITY